jgi:hypothetical protein
MAEPLHALQQDQLQIVFNKMLMKKYKTYLIFIATTLLSGCAANLVVQSEPPGAYALYQDGRSRAMPVILEYPWSDEFKNGGCMDVTTTAVVWPDSYRMDPTTLKLCKSGGNIFKYTFVRPQPSPSRAPIVTNNSSTASAVDIPTAKKKCLELGFKNGTDDLGKCVLQFTK